MLLKVNRPTTFYISFPGQVPETFKLFTLQDQLEFFRRTDKSPRIKFNMPHPGYYESNVDFNLVKAVPIEIPTKFPALPPFERKDVRDFEIVDNPELMGTPARIFRKQGIIEKGASFNSFPPSMRVFILLHEVGHFYYKTEEYCDLFALEHFLKMGYNRSTAYYTLENILKRSPGNVKRLKELFTNILKTQ